MLRFWLPYTKDTRMVGLSPTSATSFSTMAVSDGEAPNGAGRYGVGRSVFHMDEDEFGNEFTVACWCNYTAGWGGTNHLICCKNYGDDTNNTHWYFSIYSGTSLAIGINGGAAAVKAPYTFTKNTWYHLAVTYDGKTYRLFVNGNVIRTGTITTAKLEGKVNIGVGCRGKNNAGTTATGSETWKFSDFRIYDNALSEDDIMKLYQPNKIAYHFSSTWNNNLETFGDVKGVDPLVLASGHGLTMSGSSVWFNGTTSSYINFPGLNLSGGSVSVWMSIAAKPSAQKVIYYDPVGKMVLAFLSDGNFGTAVVGKSRYASTGMSWGQWNHVVATWDSGRNPTGLWVNGVSAKTTGTTTNWSTGGTMAAIGIRLGAGSANPFEGAIRDLTVFNTQLTEDEIKELYKKKPT